MSVRIPTGLRLEILETRINPTPFITNVPSYLLLTENASAVYHPVLVASNPYQLEDPIVVDLTASHGIVHLAAIPSTSSLQITTGPDAPSVEITGNIDDLNAYFASAGVSFLPTANYAGPASLRIFTFDQEFGQPYGSEMDAAIDFRPVARGVNLSVVSPVVVPAFDGTTPLPLSIQESLVDPSAPEVLSDVTVFGVPAGWTFSAGSRQPDGDWLIPAAALPGLTVLPAPGSSGSYSLTLSAYSIASAYLAGPPATPPPAPPPTPLSAFEGTFPPAFPSESLAVPSDTALFLVTDQSSPTLVRLVIDLTVPERVDPTLVPIPQPPPPSAGPAPGGAGSDSARSAGLGYGFGTIRPVAFNSVSSTGGGEAEPNWPSGLTPFAIQLPAALERAVELVLGFDSLRSLAALPFDGLGGRLVRGEEIPGLPASPALQMNVPAVELLAFKATGALNDGGTNALLFEQLLEVAARSSSAAGAAPLRGTVVAAVQGGPGDPSASAPPAPPASPAPVAHPPSPWTGWAAGLGAGLGAAAAGAGLSLLRLRVRWRRLRPLSALEVRHAPGQ